MGVLVTKRRYHRANSVACGFLDVTHLVARCCYHPHEADGMLGGWHAMREGMLGGWHVIQAGML